MNDRITKPTDSSVQPRIRGTEISVGHIYRSLVWSGLTEETVLLNHPELEPEDLVAVREYIANSIKSRTHDEFTGRPILAKEQLKHGQYYKGRCRNATIARWNSEERCFYHWREKMGRIFIETIRYPTDELEPWWDVFDAVEELPDCRLEIPFDHNAVFCGNRDDFYQYHAEMWKGQSEALR
jgi:uncharacterized protein (DUF433 family)